VSTTTARTIPATGTWRIDTVHSTARFTVTHHVVATFRAGFRDVSGALADGVLSGTVKAASIELPGPDIFREQLLGPEWFDGAGHPELSFRSSDLHTHGDRVDGTGELTIRATTRPVELRGRFSGPVEITQGETTSNRIGLDLATTIDRREFGLHGTGGADWIVTIEVALELIEVR
jgi:polyisoprenoid-binding protein YceI